MTRYMYATYLYDIEWNVHRDLYTAKQLLNEIKAHKNKELAIPRGKYTAISTNETKKR